MQIAEILGTLGTHVGTFTATSVYAITGDVPKYLWRCSACGHIVIATLEAMSSRLCAGCLASDQMKVWRAQIGNKFGTLTLQCVFELGGSVPPYGRYLCDCGKVHECPIESAGTKYRCDCTKRYKVTPTHGIVQAFTDKPPKPTSKGVSNTRARLKKIWRNMVNANAQSRYTGRCPEWDDFEVFYQWALENGYAPGRHLCRHDTKDIFSPSNCYYLEGKRTKGKQRALPAGLHALHGLELDTAKWCELCGVSQSAMFQRRSKHRLTLEDALTYPNGGLPAYSRSEKLLNEKWEVNKRMLKVRIERILAGEDFETICKEETGNVN